MDSFRTILKKIMAFAKNALDFFYQVSKNLFAFIIFLLDKYKKNKQTVSRAESDKRLVLSLSKSRIPSLTQLKYIKKYLNSKELLAIYISFSIIVISSLVGGYSFYSSHIKPVPKLGGQYTEASVGSPKYINPLYSALSDVDSDISRLIYSSLFRLDKNGQLVQDLVETQSVSDDQRIYTYKIRENVLWHNGEKMTVDDIVFTFNLIKDSSFKSPLRANFSGVAIEKIDDYNFKFNLSSPYAAFGELLTFGIMPMHVWGNTTSESISLADWNLHPIGSGPYKSEGFIKDKSGNIKEYDLIVNEEYYANHAYIDISYKFFSSFEEAITALNDNQVDGISYLPQELKENIITPKTYNFHNLSLPQLNVVFFNKVNNQILEDKEIRKALAYAINRENIVNETINGGAQIAYGPILVNNFAYSEQTEKYNYNLEQANKIFADKKWEKVVVSQEEIDALELKNAGVETGGEALSEDEQQKLKVGAGAWFKKDGKFLSIKLTTVEANENIKVVEAIQKYWGLLGVKAELEILSPSQIQTDIIRGRNFEALFYGQGLGIDPDPYAFWHSSQIGEAGYNIANYSNKEVDQLLEDARIIADPIERKAKYAKFQEIINQEFPAIFMYSPSYTYIQTKKVKGFDVKNIINPSDRFSNVEEWYIETTKKLVW